MNKLLRRASLLIGLVFILLISIYPVNAAANDNDIWWNQLGHDSRDELYRFPAGAVPTNTPIRLRMRAADGDLTGVEVRIWNDREDFEQLIPMTRIASGVVLPNDAEVYEFWEATLPASALPTVYWYRFILHDGTKTVYYEDDASRLGGWGQPFASSQDNSWQLTIYDAGFQTPDWVKNAVIYQIFPDRFRDGDPSNNPSAGEFFYGNYDTTYRSNDPSNNWNTAICDPRNVLGSNVCDGIYSQNFYGGDLQGIIDKLDYLDNLGVTAIYLNPIFESPSNHGYDTTDFFQINPRFGDLATFQTLTTEAHARGMKVILDGVFNHSSSDSIYFDRYNRWDALGDPTVVGNDDDSGACESLTSPYVDWYTFFPYAGADTAPCSDNRDYPKWFGIFDSLPVYNHDYPAVRDYFINDGVNSVGPYWMQWADGWRLDVAPEVDHGTTGDPYDNYWENFRSAVHAVNPDAYIVGEEWGNPTSWTVGGEWDATMNYQFSSATLSFWRDTPFTDNDFNNGSSAGTLNPISPSGFNERMLNLEERYTPEAFYAMMNLFGSHDTNRVLFLLDHNTGSNDTALYYNSNYDWSDAMSRQRGAALMQMTLPGAPTIYYGDEVGTINPPSYDGSRWQDDPYNRVPYPWLDETGTPFYNHMQDSVAQQSLYNYYATLTSIRNATPALRTGSFDPLMNDDANGIYAFGRQMADGSNTAVVIVNKQNSSQVATVNLADYVPAGAGMTDMLSASSVSVSAAGDVTVNLPARGGAILVYGAMARPDTVTDLVANGNAGQVSLSWSAVSGANSYDVYRSQISGGGYHFLGNTTSTNFVDSAVTNATQYFYVVVSKNDSTLLTGGHSNEASATPALSIGWANLQWPPSLTEVVSANNLSGNIYGQIWIGGATDQAGATPGLWAQVGYGNSNNVFDSSWQWFDMSFNTDVWNNDEYVGQLPVPTVGTFCYTTRYSTDSGASWFYAVNGPDEGNSTCPGPFGILTVIPASDTTPPSAPTDLSVTGSTNTSISLAWNIHPNTDGDLYGFRVYREDTSLGGYSLAGEVIGAAQTSFVDNSVSNGTNYNYYITAFDANLNESGTSNTVNADAILHIVQVTFRAIVPDFTPSVYPVHIVGSFNGWNPSDPAYALTEVSPNVWEITLNLIDTSSFEYKFARGSWDRVEKQANGYDEISNRYVSVDYGTDGTQLVEHTIANWRDPIASNFSPVDGTSDVAKTSGISFSWNKWMPTPTGGFSLTGPSGVVAGIFGDAGLNHSFTPDANLEPGVYTVYIAGAANGGDVQQVSAEWSFTVVNAAPIADAGSDQSTDEGTEISLSASATDADTDAALLSYSWTLGDGNSAVGQSVNHTYTDDGIYLVTLTVTDEFGASDSDTLEVTVLNVAPVLDTVEDVAGDEGAAIGFSATAFDPSVDVLSYEWDFGDGSPAETGQSLSHTYADNGVYTVTVTVTDGDGGSDSTILSATVANVAPTASLELSLPDAMMLPGIPVAFTFADAYDPSTVDSDTGFNYELDCDNDGTFDVSDSSPSLSCTFLAVDTYTVQGRISDKDGDASLTNTVVVEIVSPLVAIDALISHIEQLNTDGILNDGQANSLISKLENIQSKIERGQLDVAINQVGAFIEQVESFLEDGVLSADEADTLIGFALNILTSIAAMSSGG